MFVSEIYQSKQGEGLLTGTDSIFVRTSGCNLRCWFCDTPYTSWNPEGSHLELDAILKRVGQFTAEHVVITGGEPMIAKDLANLTESFKQLKKHITIETAGTVFQAVECDLMSISPKLSNSTPTEELAGNWADRHEKMRQQPEVIRQLISKHDYQMKFVVDKPDDLDEINQFLQQFDDVNRQRVLLMPQGVNSIELNKKSDWIQSSCHESGFVYCPRMHIEWYGNKRGT